ncbi:F0F1 ATP synthase subunit delta [Piscirickettsia litoralis]|uniref:ATP synthase subunit delta n=1 Tax=Piscirickettsia litoralis TaxID=1891921 RepID=A0ABX3A2D1_9GAMM|nr:F0F1 ATP synthase subunit delta [Piscirickettsia litoralis]ODN43039.1 ATP synthase F1 subunit delta [Piscirickettsia litoralis]
MEIVARPYAKAIFELARESQRCPFWSDVLSTLSDIATVPTTAAILNNPAFSVEKKAMWFLEIASKVLDAEATNLVKLLAEKNRLACLPAIKELYEAYRAEAERLLNATVTSAFALASAEQEKIAAALEKKYSRQVKLDCSVNGALIGGAIIQVGDEVIDGSVKGKLERLASALTL